METIGTLILPRLAQSHIALFASMRSSMDVGARSMEHVINVRRVSRRLLILWVGPS